MLRNFFTVALRNFLRQRLYSVINVAGLTSGLICTFFIFLWIRDEVERDQFHKDSEKIYSVVANLSQGENGIVTWGTPGPLGDAIRDRVPEVEYVVQTENTGRQLIQLGDKSFLEEGKYADADFFKIFSFPILRGNNNPPKLDKTWIYLSSSLAVKLFGSADPLGKQLRIAGKYDVAVAGIFEDVTAASSLKFDFVLPFEKYRELQGPNFQWSNFGLPCYVKLRDEKKTGEIIDAINTRTAAISDFKNVKFYMRPFNEEYLNANFENGKPSGGRIQYVKIFTLVGLFILVIACINFMNMATARAANRSKEVGIRKTAGAQRSSIVAQFLGESILISLISMLSAIIVVGATLPLFNSLVGKEISVSFLDPGILLPAILCVLLTGLLAGSYPAFYLSSFRPASVLKGALISSSGNFSLRKALVVFQFSITVILIGGAIVIFNQMEFIRNRNIGYNRHSVLTFRANQAVNSNFETFRNEILKEPFITHISKVNDNLVTVNNQNSSVTWPGKPTDSHLFFRTVVVDYDYLETMGLQLKEGRFFSRKFNDTSNFVITEQAVQTMGFANPIGQKITQWEIPGVIVGVVADINSRSMHDATDPVIFMCGPTWGNTVAVRFNPGQAGSAAAAIGKVFAKFSPEYPFEYSFMDDDFERLYENEKVTGSLAVGFTAMAIIISSLGLLGLAAYSTEHKRKEISIRKTLGASVVGLVAKISKEYVQLSIIAIIIGTPIAWYLMDKFLSGYAYHIALDWKVFVITAVSVLVVSLLTVMYQVTRAAIANPIDSLRNE